MPALTSGVLASGPRAGEIFPQPWVRLAGGSTRRLDDVLGDGFAVVGSAAQGDALARCAAAISADAGILTRAVAVGRESAEDSRLTTVSEGGTMMSDWIAAHGATIVRPNRYVFGTAPSNNALDGLADD